MVGTPNLSSKVISCSTDGGPTVRIACFMTLPVAACIATCRITLGAAFKGFPVAIGKDAVVWPSGTITLAGIEINPGGGAE